MIATDTWEGRKGTKRSPVPTVLGYVVKHCIYEYLPTILSVNNCMLILYAILCANMDMLYKLAEMYDEEKDMNLVREDDGEK